MINPRTSFVPRTASLRSARAFSNWAQRPPLGASLGTAPPEVGLLCKEGFSFRFGDFGSKDFGFDLDSDSVLILIWF